MFGSERSTTHDPTAREKVRSITGHVTSAMTITRATWEARRSWQQQAASSVW
jgi:hypothetical protein